MHVERIVVLTGLVLVSAFITAKRAQSKGYTFGTTFFMAILGYASVSLVILKLIAYMFE